MDSVGEENDEPPKTQAQLNCEKAIEEDDPGDDMTHDVQVFMS